MTSGASSCSVYQFFLNVLESLDLMANTLLWGGPHESVSRRIARARESGKRWARVACAALTAILRFNHQDHCTWALRPAVPQANEIWHWSEWRPSQPPL